MTQYTLTAPQTAMLLRMAERPARDEFTPTGNRAEALSAANWYRSNDALEKAGLTRSVSAGGARRSILTEAGIAVAARLIAEGQKTPEMAIRDAVVAHYLETGKAVDTADLAERLGWSVAKVRRVINDNHGSVLGISPFQDERASYSKSYRGMQAGSHRVWVYQPTLLHMRELLLAAR